MCVSGDSILQSHVSIYPDTGFNFRPRLNSLFGSKSGVSISWHRLGERELVANAVQTPDVDPHARFKKGSANLCDRRITTISRLGF